jgi:hypothetical protein
MAPLTTGAIKAILQEFSQQRAGRGRYVGGQGIVATGGTTIDSNGYRIHIFTSSSTPGFEITDLGSGTVEVLVVAGGGGGSTGGGGAGGLRNVPYTFTATGAYPITIGAGGAGTGATGGGASSNGNDSYIGPTGARLVSATYGGGGGSADDVRPGQPGGSGGGAMTNNNDPGGTTVASPDGISPTVQGYPGGAAFPYTGGNGMSGGGGGAGGAGEAGDPPAASPRKAGDGGIGMPISWMPASYGTPGPQPGRYFAGGGGGGTWGNPAGAGGAGGGGAGRAPGDGWNGSNAYPGTVNTGGGGGANAYPPYGNGGIGGSGIVAIRYLL